MTLSPQAEHAWLIDSSFRMKSQVKDRDAWVRKMELEEMSLPEYERPLKKIPKKRRPLSGIIKGVLKALLP